MSHTDNNKVISWKARGLSSEENLMILHITLAPTVSCFNETKLGLQCIVLLSLF